MIPVVVTIVSFALAFAVLELRDWWKRRRRDPVTRRIGGLARRDRKAGR